MENNKFDLLKEAIENIVNLKIEINEAIKYFQGGKENSGCNLIVSVVEGIQFLRDTLYITYDIQKKPISFKTMNEKLKDVVQAFENNDYILVGDLFQYEVLPIIENIGEKIKETIQ